jgi:hypothetical protein
MRRRLITWRAGTVAVATGAAVIAAGFAAYAAIPNSSTGTIDGCYSNLGGSLRVIDKQAGANCLATETPFNWNQTGRQGPTGPRGAQGAPGPNTVHWVRVTKTAAIKNSGESVSNWSVYDGTGYVYVQNSTVDLTKCAVTATPYGFSDTIGTQRFSDDYYGYVIVSTTKNNATVDSDLDLVFNCTS